MTTIAVLGLGEAGLAFAHDILAGGGRVRTYDPVEPAPDGATGCSSEADAVAGVDLVISINTVGAALAAARNAAPGLGPGTIWAETNSSSPAAKREVAATLPDHTEVVDVALMSTVPGRGIRVPMTASGPAAETVAELLRPYGAEIRVVGTSIGDAAARKLLRSVFFKGLAAAVTESLDAAMAAGAYDETWAEIARELEGATAATVGHLVEGTLLHAVRRAAEMDAAAEMLEQLGVEPSVSRAAQHQLERIAANQRH